MPHDLYIILDELRHRIRLRSLLKLRCISWNQKETASLVLESQPNLSEKLQAEEEEAAKLGIGKEGK